MKKIILITEEQLNNIVDSLIIEQEENVYTDFDTVYDYKLQGNRWYAKRKTSDTGKWYDITDRPVAVQRLNTRYGTNVQPINPPAPTPKPTPKPVPKPTPKSNIPIKPLAPAVADKTAMVKPNVPSLKNAKVGETTYTMAMKEKAPLKPSAGTKLAVKLEPGSSTPKDLPLPSASTRLPNDVVQIVNEKKKNPKFANYKGKYYVLSKENSTMYVFNNKHQLIDNAVVGRGKVVGDYPNTSDPNSDDAGLGATTPAGSAVFSDTFMDKNTYQGKVSLIKYNDPKLVPSGNLAVHPIYPPEFLKRNKILQNPAIVDKLMSWGCINVPKDTLIRPTFSINVGDSIFITKEPGRLQQIAQLNKQKQYPKRNDMIAANVHEMINEQIPQANTYPSKVGVGSPTETKLYQTFTSEVEGEGCSYRQIDANTLEISINFNGKKYLLKRIK